MSRWRSALARVPRPALTRVPRPALVRVRGRSMLPTYREGDVLLVIAGMPPRAGRPAVVRLPPDAAGRARPLSVKRLRRPEPERVGHWWVDSDNSAEGVSSVDVGTLTSDDVVAVVACRVRRGLG